MENQTRISPVALRSQRKSRYVARATTEKSATFGTFIAPEKQRLREIPSAK